jgi:hypothetical protein
VDTEAEIQAALHQLVQSAADKGLSPQGQDRLRGLLRIYRDVFCLKLGRDPPADVKPMEVVLKPGVAPFMAKSRRYSTEQREFMDRYISKLVEFGFARPNPGATWAAAPLLVAKPAPAKYRLTFDLRPVNAVTVPTAWPMPHLESELADLASSTYFATIDFASGYWQLPLSETSQSLHSFVTPQGIFQPTRMLQGARNSGANFQSRVELCFLSIRQSLKAWLDDFLLHHHSESGLLDTLASFQICRDRRLKISARKSVLFTNQVRWCGRVIDAEGVRFDPKQLSGI